MLTHNNKVMFRNQHLGNSFEKVIKVIQSCQNKEQLEGAFRMVKNFKMLFEKVGYMKFLNYKLNKELKLKNKNL